MANPARFRAPIILLTLTLTASSVLLASPVLAAGQPAARPAEAPAVPGIFASLWNAFHGLILAVGESGPVIDPDDPGVATNPPPPAVDPGRGLSIDPWG
jgi:hypothetical protein